jgi:hypothetical protein
LLIEAVFLVNSAEEKAGKQERRNVENSYVIFSGVVLLACNTLTVKCLP